MCCVSSGLWMVESGPHALKSPHLSARNFIVRILAVMNCFLFTETPLLLSSSSSSLPAAGLLAQRQQQSVYHFSKHISISFTCREPLHRVSQASLCSNPSCLESSPSDGHIYLPVKTQERTHWSVDKPPHEFKSISAGNKRWLDKER